MALLSISPMVLLPVAAIVFGAALLLGSLSTARLSSLASGPNRHLVALLSLGAAAIIAGAAVGGSLIWIFNH